MYKLLLVDDFFVERENVKDIIHEFNIELDIIAEVENGKQALEVIERNCPDFILTDIEMPIMNGIELAEIVHKKYPQIKIIFFSFYNKFEYAQRAISFDVHAYILKPIVPEEMIVSLKKIIEQKKQEELQSEEQLELKKLVAESFPLLVNQFKLDLFMGRYKQEEDIFRRLDYLNTPYKRAVNYAVVVLELDSYSTIMNSRTLDEIDMLEVLVSKIIGKAVSEFDSTLFARVEDNHWAILINGEAGDSSAEPGVTDQTSIGQVSIEQTSIGQISIGQTPKIECSNTNRDQLAELYNKTGDFSMQLLKELSEHNISASIGISSSFTSLLEVNRKFKEGLYALEFKYGLGNGQIIRMDDIQPSSKAQPLSSADIESGIRDIIYSGEINGVEPFICKLLLCQYDGAAAKNKSFLKNTCYSILACTQAVLSDLNIRYEDIFGNDEMIWDKLIRFETIVDTRQWLINILRETIDYINTRNNSQVSKVVETIKQICERNYSGSITIKAISDEMFYNPNYLNNLFKQETGETILEYITKLRMEKAKQLLREPYVKIYEIAQRVGYAHESYFRNLFKQYVGIGPKEYREKLKIKDNV